MDIRNIAIIAHVDHGKTTLTDALLQQAGVAGTSTSMDSNDLEQERGITIYSKNCALMYKDTKINIVDTPGHADFGSEVERVLRSIDSVLLVVDAQEGPMPQTRFVLKKSLELGINPIVVVNKIDKPAADLEKCEEEVLMLFFELGASDEQADFPVVYAIGRDGIAKRNAEDESSDLTPLLDVIMEHVPATSSDELMKQPLRLQPFNLGYDNFLGRLAIARVHEGVIKSTDNVFVKQPDGTTRSGKITKLFSFMGLDRVDVDQVSAGDIAMVAGLPDIDIGETVMASEELEPLPAIAVDEPTISLMFLVNDSPFAGREGEYVTTRNIRDFLERELEVNVGLRVDFSSADAFKVYGRGELHIVVLLENMRRAGYEVQVSQPQAIVREENGKKIEPYEEVTIDTPEQHQGKVIEKLGRRGFHLHQIIPHENSLRLTFEGPTRGLLGYKTQFVIDTKGEGILSSRFIEFRPHAGEITKRNVGSMVSMANGKALAYALDGLQERGTLYIPPSTEVYEGMVIGNTANREEMHVNPTKGKQLTNMRAAGSDKNVDLSPPMELTLERSLEIMSDDEYLEVTPKSIRIRKQYLTELARSQAKLKAKEAAKSAAK